MLETVSGIPAAAAALSSELAKGTRVHQLFFSFSEDHIEICQGSSALWIVIKRPGAGGFALRTASSLDSPLVIETRQETATGYEVILTSALGTFRVELQIPDSIQSLIRCTTRLTPAVPLLFPACPRDLYPLDEQGNPAETQGSVHAAQRGYNAPIVYLTLNEPKFGSLLYFQHLTALNPYFLQTETKPDGAVGGQWPELGYQLPTSLEKPLAVGQEITLSDTFLCWNAKTPENNLDAAHDFLDLLATVYRFIEKPKTDYHDWLTKAEETLRDLQCSPKATIKHYGHTYVHPYTDAEYPDSMVQMTVQLPLREYAEWKREPIPFADELWKGMPRFFDTKLETVRRYLPNVGKDKNANEVDSWYLYHPLTNLGRLAKEGNQEAKALFCTSMDYAIKVARHFHYEWPIQFDVETLEVIKEERKEGAPGQSDVGGLYAYVMLQAWDLTEHKRYLEEAKRAIDKLQDIGFETLYQSNLTAWGVNACLRLWHTTREERYRKQSHVFLANFFHNTVLWESELGTAKDYMTFLGAACLHDGPYMAIYECFESYCAFYDFLKQGQDDLPPNIQLLLTEYCKYTLSRAWSFYPKELPKEALATENRNGHIDRELAFPLEDMYPEGQPAGQVGQEIYGCGAAFAFVTRAYNRFTDAPFLLFSEYPLFPPEERDRGVYTLRLCGADGMKCSVRAVPLSNEPLPAIHIRLEDGTNEIIEGTQTKEGHVEYVLPANTPIGLRWSTTESKR